MRLSLSTEQPLSDEQRQYNWERGQIDYLGADSFDSILSRLNAKLMVTDTESKSTPSEVKPREEATVTESLQPSGAI